MNTVDLLKLADFLDTLPKDRFNYALWTSVDWVPDTHACGTTGCALGWAASMPEFQAKGLRFEPEFSWSGEKCYPLMRFEEHEGSVDAGTAFFDLTVQEFDYLFIPDMSGLNYSAGPKCLAGHIRRFVDAGGIPHE